MRDFLLAALIVVVIGGGLAVPLSMAIAKMAVSGPPRWLRFNQRDNGDQVVGGRPDIFIASMGVSGLWSNTTSTSAIYMPSPGVTRTGAAPIDVKIGAVDNNQVAA
ncbi:hypothetical protein [Methylobacterium sp. SI9]|uniref:hypothetical protein n=1 Tax=Methylobacterium guangdongense TaxID=3138811 RepID=UPI00313EB4CD